MPAFIIERKESRSQTEVILFTFVLIHDVCIRRGKLETGHVYNSPEYHGTSIRNAACKESDQLGLFLARES